jgi:cellulose synthase/poly-beta-1,6-N-acetylglucosamine synthase-like glycosyltransferase
LNWNKWVRQIHRWLSIAFTVAVIVNIVALGQEKPAVWVGLLALLPLAFLLFTGLYLFVLPYARACLQLSRMIAETKCTAPRKLPASLS